MKKNVFRVCALLLVTVFIFVGCASVSEDTMTSEKYSNDYVSAMQASDYEKAAEVLADWEKADSENPEMLIGYFNYYLNRSLQTIPTLGQMEDGRQGYFPKPVYDNNDVFIGISYLDKALEKNPSRLDIHFGKCASLLRTENFKEASSAIVDLLETSKEVNNMWLWTNNEVMVQNSTDGETQLFYGMNDYAVTLFNNFDRTQPYLIDIFTTTEQLYPNNIIGLNLSARYYSQISDYDKAISLLERAVSLDENDYIVLGNLGYTYEIIKNYPKAKECYERMLTINDENSRQYGLQSLAALEEKL